MITAVISIFFTIMLFVMSDVIEEVKGWGYVIREDTYDKKFKKPIKKIYDVLRQGFYVSLTPEIMDAIDEIRKPKTISPFSTFCLKLLERTSFFVYFGTVTSIIAVSRAIIGANTFLKGIFLFPIQNIFFSNSYTLISFLSGLLDLSILIFIFVPAALILVSTYKIKKSYQECIEGSGKK